MADDYQVQMNGGGEDNYVNGNGTSSNHKPLLELYVKVRAFLRSFSVVFYFTPPFPYNCFADTVRPRLEPPNPLKRVWV